MVGRGVSSFLRKRGYPVVGTGVGRISLVAQCRSTSKVSVVDLLKRTF